MSHFTPLRVAEVSRETDEAISVLFDVPSDVAEDFQYQPGQHITIRKDIDGEELRRCYSICSAVQDQELRVAIKQVPDGRFSGFANRDLKAGDCLDVMLPQGVFTHKAHPEKTGQYLAFAAGSGITPILSIVKSTLIDEPDSSFTLVYSNRSTKSTMFRETLMDLKDRFAERLQLVFIMSREHTESDLLSGRVDAEKVAQLNGTLLNFEEFDQCYVCGPEPMMESVLDGLKGENFPEDKTHAERFNTGHVRSAEQHENAAKRAEVIMTLEGRTHTLTMTDQDDNILDAALDQGADLPYACKGGVCATCKCRVLEGEVEMGVNYSLEKEQLEAGLVLSCQAWPTTEKVVLDFDV